MKNGLEFFLTAFESKKITNLTFVFLVKLGHEINQKVEAGNALIRLDFQLMIMTIIVIYLFLNGIR